MNYARKQLLNKRLPAYTGFLVLLAALGITVFFSRNAVTTVTKATVGSVPKDIHISNVSDTSFTISYITDATVVGTIAYGKDASTADIALDDRDQQTGKPIEHQIHFITVKNLTPSTTYYYVLVSGSQKIDNNGKPFEIATAQPLTSPAKDQPTLSGTVALADGSSPTEGIVYVSTNGSQQMAALIAPDGSYHLPLTTMRTNTFALQAQLLPDTILALQAVTATQQSSAKVIVSNATQVPKIVLEQNYDFTLNTETASDSGNIATGAAFPIFATPQPVSSPEITSPTDTQTYNDQQPTFSGRALPNAEVSITIQSQQEISTKVQSDGSGSWEFRPPVVLDPGQHTITIKSLDASGVLQTITRSFTVYAAGSQFVEPSISPIASPSATVAPIEPPTPTVAPSPTASPSPKFAATPTLGPTRGPLSPTGSSAVMIGVMGTVFAIGIGLALFAFSIL